MLLLLGEFLEKIYKERSLILSNFPIIREIDQYITERLWYQWNKIELIRGQDIFRENDPSDCIYFILNGEVEVLFFEDLISTY